MTTQTAGSNEARNGSYAGQVAVITGCGQADGIGFAIAQRLNALGAHVVMSDRPKTGRPGGDGEVEALADKLNSGGAKALAVRASVTSESDCAELVKQAVAAFGKVDILVNNAGADHGGERTAFAKISLADWNRVIEVNLTGGFLMCRAVIPVMAAQKYGRIVNISSLAALRGSAHRAVYGASKAGLLGLTLGLAVELAVDGITVNAVCPGPIETARARSTAMKNAQGGDMAAAMRERAARVPVGRLGQAADVAQTVCYLADPASGFVTGQVIGIDGGIGARLG
jgi:3-oxoacyl-[acyl-carrier protein] reductase